MPDYIDFILPGGDAVRLPVSTIQRFITTELTNCLAPSCRMSEQDALACVKWVTKQGETAQPATCLYHMLVFAENLALTVYMYILASDPNEAENYAKFMEPLLQQARRMVVEAKKALENGDIKKAQKIAGELLLLLLEYGVDPW